MKTVRTWCIRILMILFTVIFLYPLFWNLMSAFKTNAEYLTDPYALPTALNLDNFVAAWQKANIAAYFGNSIFVTVFSTVLLLLLVIPISYVLARYRFAGSKLISAIYMACIFLQATYIMIPLFLELQAVNGLNNLPVLCLVYAVMQFPFCIFTFFNIILYFYVLAYSYIFLVYSMHTILVYHSSGFFPSLIFSIFLTNSSSAWSNR